LQAWKWLAEPKLNERSWCSRQGLHLHWRRSQRRVSSFGLRELLRRAITWILQPVLPRQEFFTKEIHSLLRGVKWSQPRVLPSAELAYDACLSAGSIAVLADDCYEPTSRIAPNWFAYRAKASLTMLWGPNGTRVR
jgi:hypothetical protein